MRCRVCTEDTGAPVYDAPAPALTSIMTLVDVPTRVFICKACGHAQTDDLPDIAGFYDTGYRISLESREHDQAFEVRPNGTPVFRTDHQAAIVLRLLDLPPGAALLDYGAAKAATLAKICAARPDLRPHVFDVSADYAAAWQDWVPQAAQAVYALPAHWSGSFDAVMSHFAIEHVTEPVDFIRRIGALLRPGGRMVLSLPDPAANPGDMIVADHLSHFSGTSVRRAVAEGGLRVLSVDRTSFPGAFFVVAEKDDDILVPIEDPHDAVKQARATCRFWQEAAQRLDLQAQRLRGSKAAIYGAGFYGAWIRSRVGGLVDVLTVLDRNPHLQMSQPGTIPILPPEQMPADVSVLFVGLNPLKAREIVAAQPSLNRPGLQHIWLD